MRYATDLAVDDNSSSSDTPCPVESTPVIVTLPKEQQHQPITRENIWKEMFNKTWTTDPKVV